ncbi:hypothetical protein SCAR479_08765 [Seiridium cardinale]|uniref:Chromo domain-containing protein n=1 Tax=Seiridium cardinale TaxID=138064 RepID=A0ABR2XLX2_9PEZI
MHKNSNRIRKSSSRRYPIEVVLPSRQKRYAGGLGPALAPLRIALKNDSTAYITGKEIEPTWTRDGGLKLQLYYIVQWTDLPAAAVLIEAHRILDYVSPRTLEDYEYKLSLERDAQEEEYRRSLEEAKRTPATLKGFQSTDTSIPGTPTVGQKKPGRPKKAGRRIKKGTKSHAADVFASPSSTSAKTSGPSLSTPQKSLDVVADELAIDDDLDEEDGDGDGAIIQQPYDADDIVHHSPLPRSRSAHILDITPRGSSSLPNSDLQLQQKTGQAVSAGGFTPAACSAGKWPSPERPDPPADSPYSHVVPKSVTKSSRKRKRQEPDEPQPMAEEPRWKVKRVEGDEILEVQGEMQRCFRVRWEGDWPPDQNPTWEPEANLSRNLVREYLKKKAARVKKSGMGATKAKKRPVVPLVRKYSSVAEAFEGGVEDEALEPTPLDFRDDMEAEERLLVEERERTAEPIRHSSQRKDLNFAGLRSYVGLHSNGNGYGHGQTSPNPNL